MNKQTQITGFHHTQWANRCSFLQLQLSPVLRLSFPLMDLFPLRIMPTVPTVPTPSAVPTFPTASDVPIARNTPDTSETSHPIDSEVLAQGSAPITAE